MSSTFEMSPGCTVSSGPANDVGVVAYGVALTETS